VDRRSHQTGSLLRGLDGLGGLGGLDGLGRLDGLGGLGGALRARAHLDRPCRRFASLREDVCQHGNGNTDTKTKANEPGPLFVHRPFSFRALGAQFFSSFWGFGLATGF
jgi:hypothetical protein